MGKINFQLKKLTSLPGIKIAALLFAVGFLLMLMGKVLPANMNENTVEEKSVTHTEQEQKLAGILSGMEGVGEVEVIIYTKDKTSSVLVLATGADDPAVNLKIRQAVRTILQTDNENIKIIKKQS